MNRSLKLKIVEKFGNQADFSMAVGVAESTISRVVRERRILKEDEQDRWARVLRCRREDIFQRGL